MLMTHPFLPLFKMKMKVLVFSIMTFFISQNGLSIGKCYLTQILVKEVLFSRKKKVQSHPILRLTNVPVEKSPYQKHLGLVLDEQLNFKQHINYAISKINKGIAVVIKKL